MAPMVQLGRITALRLRAPKSSTISSTVTSERFAASTASFCTPTMPSMQHVAVAVGLERVDHATSGRIAGTAASRSPVNGQVMCLMLGFTVGRSTPMIAAKDRERQPGRARLVGVGHGGVRMLLDRDRLRPAVLDRVAEAVQRADAGIAAPGEHQLVGAAHADELVVDEVRRHPDQREMLAALADDLVPRRIRNEMGEPLHGHGIAIPDGRFDGLGEGQETGHAGTSQ